MSDNRYMMRGVSAAKEDVHNAIKNIDKGIFPQAFCKIIPDILGGDPEYCLVLSLRWLICTGKKLATFLYGRVLPRMPSS